MRHIKIIIPILLVFACVLLFIIMRGRRNRIEYQTLRNVQIYKSPLEIGSVLNEYKIAVVMELEGDSMGHEIPPYSAKETTVRNLLNAVVPETEYVWQTEGDFIHIISRSLAARSDYQLNTLIEQFAASELDHNALIKMALARLEQRNAPEPLVFAETPYKDFGININLPKISINMQHATLRQILDQICHKAGISYRIYRIKTPGGSYQIVLTLLDKISGLQQIEEQPNHSNAGH